MGALRAANDEPAGHVCNGVALGDPVVDGDGVHRWDDSAFPNGTVAVIGGQLAVTPDGDE